MKKLEVKDLKENFFEAIGKEWMLVTAGTKEKALSWLPIIPDGDYC